MFDLIFAHVRTLVCCLEVLLHSDPELQVFERQRKLGEGLRPESFDYSTLGVDLARRFERERRFVPFDVLRSFSSARELVRDLAEVALLEGLFARAYEFDRHVA